MQRLRGGHSDYHLLNTGNHMGSVGAVGVVGVVGGRLRASGEREVYPELDAHFTHDPEPNTNVNANANPPSP